MIPYGRQDITQADIDVVVGVLRSDFLTQGPAVVVFEHRTRDVVNARYAVAVSSATAALHVACMALDLGPGDLLWTVPNTFVASANCALYCGADVDFVDIDAATWNMSVVALRTKLADAGRSGRLPKIVVPVHFGGQPTDQEAIHELGQEYGFRIIEDASHAIGASRDGEPVGSCRWSDITIFSFHPVKLITTGEGGMAMTNDARIAEHMAMLRTHGITRDPGRLRARREQGAWYYEQQLLGYNYRMTDIQAALGSSQLERLTAYIERRNVLAARYYQGLDGLPLQLPIVSAGNRSAWHLYVVRVKAGGGTAAHRHLFDRLRGAGIGVNVHYMPVHLQPYYTDLGFEPGLCPEAEAHGREAITLPLFGTMTDAEQDAVVAALHEAL
jgi:UDP-4-amino-4,6-dideoxy-N-acetyl-beta-L-altrosamine transaminase